MHIMSKTGGNPAASWAGPCGRARTRGFTLIELMIVVVVIAILAAIAVPGYGSYMQRARRTDATRALTEAAAAMERYFSQNQTYAISSLGPPANVYPATSPEGYYNLSISGASATQYTLTATPTGKQAGDACGNFILTNASTRTVSGSISAKDCWKLN